MYLRITAEPADSNGQADQSQLVDHVQELERPPIQGVIELEGERAEVMGIHSSQ